MLPATKATNVVGSLLTSPYDTCRVSAPTNLSKRKGQAKGGCEAFSSFIAFSPSVLTWRVEPQICLLLELLNLFRGVKEGQQPMTFALRNFTESCGSAQAPNEDGQIDVSSFLPQNT